MTIQDLMEEARNRPDSKVEKVHFTVGWGWATDFARQAWSEGNYQWTLDFLRDMGAPKESHWLIIMGKCKMIPHAKNPDNGDLAEDNWEPDLSRCHLQTYPDPDRMWEKVEELEKYHNWYIRTIASEVQRLLKRRERRAMWSMFNDEIETINGYLRSVPEEVFEYLQLDKEREVGEETWYLAEIIDSVPGIPTVEEYIDNVLSFDLKELKENLEKDHGWILPDGTFYGCHRTGHTQVCAELGLEEKSAENRSWLKIATELDGKHYFSIEKEPTQAQLNKLWDWAQKHNLEKLYMDFIGE